MAPVGLGLRMDVGIPVNLGGGGLEDTCLDPLGKAEAVDGPDHGGLHGLDGIVLVVRGGSGAGEVIDPIYLELERVDHVVTDEFEAGISNEMLDIGLASSEEIVEADDFMSLLNEAIAEVGTKESGTAGD
jgi:hypothetical protein